jgi:hypothetical protein
LGAPNARGASRRRVFPAAARLLEGGDLLRASPPRVARRRRT